MLKPVSLNFFAKPTLEVAPKLIGKILEINGVSGKIVEVEAYTNDPASHAFSRTQRSAVMFDTFGHIYVYFIYGMYFCLNFTTDKHHPGAVLIRAVEPLSGIQTMRKRRKIEKLEQLCNGPGKLCQAFGIDKTLNHTQIGDKVKIFHGSTVEIGISPRIGITKAVELPWRFFEKGSPYLSKKS